jgi:hypothetical protein
MLAQNTTFKEGTCVPLETTVELPNKQSSTRQNINLVGGEVEDCPKKAGLYCLISGRLCEDTNRYLVVRQ